jgi:O-antigen ligase
MINEQKVRYYLSILAIVITLIGLVISRAMMSIGMIILIANAFLNKDLPNNFKGFIRNPTFWIITLVFFVYLFSGIYSERGSFFFGRLRIKIPFLLLPFAFFSIKEVSKKMYHGLLAFFVILIFTSSLVTFARFLMNYNEIVDQYLHAKTIDTPFSHIRFSLMVVFSVGLGIYLFLKKFSFRFAWEPIVYLAMAIWLFVFMHILAVRSGLLALYVGIFTVLIFYIIRSKNWKLGGSFILLILLIPILAYFTIPTFKNKLTYMGMDISVYNSGESISNYSDARRLASIQAGLDIGKTQPFIGVGVGNLQSKLEAYYLKRYPEISKEEYIIPHNQVVFVFCATGIIGVLIFFSSLIMPVFKNKNYELLPFALINIIVWTSFLSEATLENQIGTTFYITFFLLSLSYLKSQVSEGREAII